MAFRGAEQREFRGAEHQGVGGNPRVATLVTAPYAYMMFAKHLEADGNGECCVRDGVIEWDKLRIDDINQRQFALTNKLWNLVLHVGLPSACVLFDAHLEHDVPFDDVMA